ncbi:WecB/TagA/CpsF family glycosyltransferase [Flavobacteriaceae bacterium D16]|nr:WecB/TagA/CpsF family glycosyltransferase [Flavobacteriaceae bacterium D16]
MEHPLTLLKQRALENYSEGYKKEIITFLNPYSYLFFRKNTTLFRDFDRIYLDGIILVKALRAIGVRAERRSFDMTSIAPEIFQLCVKEKKNIYFIGSDSKSIEKFIQVIKSNYPDLNILGWRSGYFQTPEEREATQETIAKLNPDFLVVGMGTPLQEVFLKEVRAAGWQGTGFTCGGFIHQTAAGLHYYPKWSNKLNLRWLYRIWDEPKLLNRYLLQYPKFVALYIFDLLSVQED